ncbi:MAG: glucose-1-phosphate thymidylyltransferase [Bacteroidota bacterium]|nr:glucose-1-phosphate thymidylyltransferase [Bacteroidota bacterium]
MAQRNLILLDPASSINLWPLSRTRPLADLRCGILSIREKWEYYLDAQASNYCNSTLSQVFPVQVEEENWIILGSLIPEIEIIKRIHSLKLGQCIESPEGQFIAAHLNKNECLDFMNGTKNQSDTASISLFRLLEFPWQLFQWNAEELEKDFELLTKNRASQNPDSSNTLLGGRIFIEEGAQVICSTLNANQGPIYIGKNAEVMEGCMIRGGFALGEDAQLKMGAKIYGATSIGPGCRVGGEVSNSIIQAHSNKAHDGFLGNSLIGEWCNIGADSNSSNLKNNYDEVKVWNYQQQRFIRTGSQFCGLIMGDHAKCGINTMFNTGTLVGVGANVFGDGFPRQFIPDFAWGGASGYNTFQLDKFFITAEIVMNRRNKILSENQKQLLERIFQESAVYRNWESS